MCEMCAYVGRTRSAAPVLLEYGKRVEGLWSGFATGIGVQDREGNLSVRKTLGYSKYWEQQFRTDELPGTVGFFHSRTGYHGMPGDRRYAHPFLASDGSSAAVSQGAIGIFAGRAAGIAETGNQLLDHGIRFSSADFLKTDRFHLLKDGTRVHMSDIVNEFAAFLAGQGVAPLEAVRRVGSEIQEESVTLFLFRKYPGRLYGINMNQRMYLFRHADGISLANCALAFGDERVEVMNLPCNCVFEITPDSVRIERLSAEFNAYPNVPSGMEDAFLQWVGEHPHTQLACLMDNVLKLRYPDGVLRHVPVHEIFEQLYYDGKLRLDRVEYPGVGEEKSIRFEISRNL